MKKSAEDYNNNFKTSNIIKPNFQDSHGSFVRDNKNKEALSRTPTKFFDKKNG